MKTRKPLALTLAIALMLTLLAGCGGSNTSAPETTAAPVAEAPAADATEAPAADAAEASAGEYDLNEVQERRLVFGHTGAPGSTNEVWAETLKEAVAEKSGGKIIIDTYGASQLGSDVSICTDVQNGAVDLQVCSPAALVTIIPGGAVFDMPCLFKDVESARAALANEEFFTEVAAGYEAVGLKLLTLYDQQFRELTTNKEIKSYEDLSGMSLRTMNNAHHIAFWTAMGAAPTPMDTAEVFTALQQGMIDGQENPYGQDLDKKMYDVQKYLTNSNHIFYVGDVFMSMKTWEQLSAVEQQIFADAVAETKAKVMEFVDENEGAARDKLVNELGMTFIDFDQIEGMRDAMHEATFQVAYDSIAASIGTDLLDKWVAAAGY